MKERLVFIISDYINVFIYLFVIIYSYYEIIKIVTKFLSGDKTNIAKKIKEKNKETSLFSIYYFISQSDITCSLYLKIYSLNIYNYYLQVPLIY